MFFWLYIDKNDAITRKVSGGCDVIGANGRSRGSYRARFWLTATFVFSLVAESVYAAPPLFDTSVRIGAPFFARVRFPAPVSANLGVIRLPSDAEVAAVGGTWQPLQASLELVPSASKVGVYYLNSRFPVERDSFDIYLAQERVDALDILAFDVRLVGGATRVSTQTLRSQLVLDNQSSVQSSSGKSIANSKRTPEAAYPITTSMQPPIEPPYLDKQIQPRAKVQEVELDDDLSEKLRKLITAQVASNQKTLEKTVPAKGNETSFDDQITRLETVESTSQRQKVGNHLESATLGVGQSVSNQEEPVMIAARTPEREIPQVQPPRGLLDWQFSMAELLLIALVLWLVYFGRIILRVKKRLLDSPLPAYNTSNDKKSSVTGDTIAAEQIHPFTGVTQTSPKSSALADVLRTTAEQAERAERLGAQSRLDAGLASLAAAQQQALFDCATRLHGLNKAEAFPDVGAVAGQMPNQAPSQTHSSESNHAQVQAATVRDPRLHERQEQETGRSYDDSASKFEYTQPHQVQPPVSPKSNPSDQRSTRSAEQAQARKTAETKAQIQNRGLPPTAPATPKIAKDRKPPAPTHDYSEQISLAAVYFNMGEVETARKLLETVIKDGSAKEKAEARKFIEENIDV